MIILSIVEGLTEYLPISSTGHMIVVSSLMGISENQFTKDFTVIVQFGAILAVLVLYWKRFLTSWSFYQKLFVAVLPAGVIGIILKDKIDLLLGDVRIVAWAFIIGGVVLLFIDRVFAKQEAALELNSDGKIEQLTYLQSLLIGLAQCAAFIPGVSRSAASIIGGLGVKMTRKAAAEFSFFMAVPTLGGATLLKVLKIYKNIQPDQISLLLIGNVIAFIVGGLTIKTFITYLTKRGFFFFGVYRILVGAFILIMLAAGHQFELI
jgi:undecaprenyl-diphosphatase